MYYYVVVVVVMMVVVVGKSREIVICELSSSLSSTAMAGVAVERPFHRKGRLAMRVIGTRIVVVDADHQSLSVGVFNISDI